MRFVVKKFNYPPSVMTVINDEERRAAAKVKATAAKAKVKALGPKRAAKKKAKA